jgi:hypothetical protein
MGLKKNLFVWIGLFFVLLLASCSQAAEPVNQDVKKTGSNEKQTDLTLEQVIHKSKEASDKVKSFAMKTEIQQDIKSTQEEPVKLHSAIDMSVVNEPFVFYQKLTTEMEPENEPYETEAYFTVDGMYFFEKESETWMKFPAEMSDQLLRMSGEKTNPAEELNRVQEYVDDFSFTQNNSSYLIHFTSSKERFNDFFKEIINETIPNQLAGDNNVLNTLKFSEVTYELDIDKKTYLPSKLRVSMNIELETEGQSIKLRQEMKSHYSNYNKIGEIKIPQEAIDTAVEMEM